ncbi:hypothetical protein QFC21_002817 [Naganishia friedmannii]|uniref:Uncharacterized protein n=1 Tax=Naganishia friedmannii TaxID=89922 RepID=A0ACC2VU42_9TREE|nr:hypothetical protein QFC21_002817 [Naganishia friedmannii]
MSDTEDFFSDSLALFDNGDDVLPEPPTEVQYGPIRSKIPEMEGKGFTMLASQIFNSGLVMAEMVELGRINASGTRSKSFVQLQSDPHCRYANTARCPSIVLELGASTSLPSLLASTLDPPPELILTTDYPDAQLIKYAKRFLSRIPFFHDIEISKATSRGTHTLRGVLSTLDDPSRGFTLVILSDTLWLHDEHSALLRTISSALSHTEPAFTYFTTGHYAKRAIVNEFFKRIQDELGMEYEELVYPARWEGEMVVDVGMGRPRKDLDARKGAVWCFRAWRKGFKPVV